MNDAIYIANANAERLCRTKEIETIRQQAHREGWEAHRQAIEAEVEKRKAVKRQRIQNVIGLFCGMGFIVVLVMFAMIAEGVSRLI